MIINSVGSTTGTTSVEKVKPVELPVKTFTETPTKQHKELIHNTKQLKLAELHGQKIGIGEQQIVMAIERANKALQGSYTSFEFSIHEATKEIMVKVLDRDTGELIREIPSEKILDMVAKMWEMSGVLVDERG